MATTNPADYKFPRFAFSPGWPKIIVDDGSIFALIRDGSPTDNPALGNSALYARVLDSRTGEIAYDLMYTPSTSINADYEGSAFTGMKPGPWSSNDELAAAGVPVCQVPPYEEIVSNIITYIAS